MMKLRPHLAHAFKAVIGKGANIGLEQIKLDLMHIDFALRILDNGLE